MKLEKMLEKLIMTDPVELLKESIENQTIEVNRMNGWKKKERKNVENKNIESWKQ